MRPSILKISHRRFGHGVAADPRLVSPYAQGMRMERKRTTHGGMIPIRTVAPDAFEQIRKLEADPKIPLKGVAVKLAEAAVREFRLHPKTPVTDLAMRIAKEFSALPETVPLNERRVRSVMRHKSGKVIERWLPVNRWHVEEAIRVLEANEVIKRRSIIRKLPGARARAAENEPQAVPSFSNSFVRLSENWREKFRKLRWGTYDGHLANQIVGILEKNPPRKIGMEKAKAHLMRLVTPPPSYTTASAGGKFSLVKKRGLGQRANPGRISKVLRELHTMGVVALEPPKANGKK